MKRLLAGAAAMALSTAHATVTQLASNGFVVRHEATVSAPPGKVYEALVQVGSWWSSDHTYSGDAKNLSIDARAGGCFCERLSDGGSVEHKMAPAVDMVLGEQFRRLKAFVETGKSPPM